MPDDERVPGDYFKAVEIPGVSYHDVIYAVRAAPDGTIYLGVSSEFYGGTTSKLYAYDPSTETFKMVGDVEEITGDRAGLGRLTHSKIHLAICIGADGTVYAGTHLTAPPRGIPFLPYYETFGDPDLGYPGGKIIAYHPRSGKAELIGTVSPYQGIRVMTIDRERNILYCMTFALSHLVRFDLASRTARDLGRVSMENSMALFLDRRGRVYFSDDRGFFQRYDPDKDEIERLSVRLPDAAWRNGRGNHIRRIVADADGHTFWGVPFKSERIFSYDTEAGPHGRVVDYGHFLYDDRFNRWPHLIGIKAMAVGRDGRLYLSASEEEPYMDPGTSHIYSFDPTTGEKRDFGVMEYPGLPGIIYAVDADTGLDGKIYFGARVKDPPPQLAVFTPPSPVEAGRISRPVEVNTEPGPPDDHSLWVVPDVVQPAAQPAQSRFDRGPVFVVEGHTSLRELGFGEEGLLIPDGESAIHALAVAGDGRIVGATSGRRSHLFSFDPHGVTLFTDGPNAHVLHLALIRNGPAVCRALVTAPDGVIYGGIIEGSEDEPRGGRLFAFDPRLIGRVPEALGLPRRPYALGPRPMIHDLGAVPDGQGVEALTVTPDGGLLCGITTPKAGLFVYDVQLRRFVTYRELPSRIPCKAIVSDDRGRIYGSVDMGWLFRYSSANDELDILEVRLPVEHGREYLAYVHSFAKGPDGTVYGGTAGDGWLFRLDAVGDSITALGRPTRRNTIPALAVTLDGRVYGISNQIGDVGRLFVYDPQSQTLRDLGILQCAGVPKFWIGHQFGAMAVGPAGEVYIGEADRISHLFIYYPPIARRHIA